MSTAQLPSVGSDPLDRDIAERIAALNSIEAYIEWMRPEFLPDFDKTPAAHHKLFAAVIEGLGRGELDRELISVPPGSGKSMYFSIIGPTYLLARDPADKILCITASEFIANTFAIKRRQILKSPRWQALASTTLMPDAQSLQFQGTPEGGGIYSFGAGSTIQSIRATYLMPDDLVTGIEMSRSLMMLDKLWDWYISEARTRLVPSGRECMIATRWALLDPIGRALKLTTDGHEKWNYLRIPEECDEPDDPLGRQPGDPLWPEYFTQRRRDDAKRSKIIWNTLHQQRPAADEFGWVPAECIQVVQDAPERLTYYIGVDISMGIDGRDYTAMSVIGIDEANNFWLVHLHHVQHDAKKTASVFLDLCAKYSPKYCWIENDNASIMWREIVQSQAMQRGQKQPPLLLSHMKNRDKEVRAAPLNVLFIEMRVFILNRPWREMVVAELAVFLAGRHDDIVDSMAVVAMETKHLRAPKTKVVEAPKPITGAIQMKEGKLVTTQNLETLFKLNAGGKRRARI